jgi:predicted DNA-binding protein YlxM (UPF0122 family)
MNESLTKLNKDHFRDLDTKKKGEYCLNWKFQGLSVTEISEFLKVSPRTVYNWMHEARSVVLEELEAQRPIDLVVEHMHTLESMFQLCMYEASLSSNKKLEYHPESDTISKKDPDSKAFNDSMKTALQVYKSLMDLQQSVGLLPRTSEKIYHVVSDNKIDNKEEDLNLTNEQKKEMLLQKLNRVKSLT